MPESVLDALCSAINSHDPRQVAACFTADFNCERPLRPYEGFVGHDRVQENWTRIFAGISDLRAEILRHVRDGDEIWSEWEMRGTGPGGGTALLRGPVIVTAADGRIDWARFYLDPVTHRDETTITVSGVVAAPAEQVFAVLADPRRHRALDASGTIRHTEATGSLTAVGDTFIMAMHNDMNGDYVIENHVVVYEAGRAIGWAPAAPGQRPLGQRYTWCLTPLEDGSTEVTQTYDWSGITHPPALPHLPVRSADELTESIQRLKSVLT
ncbi:nuclear transport factor 2 family protein [Streptomyces sp. WMMC500]|uniref:nuclear transport factor 2 family protein n=1 Tax=Streptomyces sp. WMMC500 TaxID=3015154 RepID=UPI00248C5DB1|nr:nuclear transport factor 2 family protein [Streptomyces sp. WMMC500]WBB58494.1 nuclear transport factor 2 family protein [Streptomyces sp. WMMC500]